jgi:HEPN domain-containing protein
MIVFGAFHGIPPVTRKVTRSITQNSKKYCFFFGTPHCQQALEKLVKAIYILLVGPKIPYVHEIYDIFQLVNSQLTEPADSWLPDLFDLLSDYYLEARYPPAFGVIRSSVDREESEKILSQTKEAFQ